MTDARLTVSDRERLQTQDFAQMSTAEIALAKVAMQRLVLPFNEVATRRLAASRRGRGIDLRRGWGVQLRRVGAGREGHLLRDSRRLARMISCSVRRRSEMSRRYAVNA